MLRIRDMLPSEVFWLRVLLGKKTGLSVNLRVAIQGMSDRTSSGPIMFQYAPRVQCLLTFRETVDPHGEGTPESL